MSKEKNDLIVVGIGASAGGLEALQSFVQHAPTNTNFVYLVAQHLSPTYKSLMVDLLSKDSPIAIKEAKSSQEIEADTMYICPPNKNIMLEENNIILMEPKELTYGPKPSINILFESIAISKANKAIGIILSGTGSDGARGVRAIKVEGGFTIAQQPQNAKYDGMPNSAINTGNIDLILDTEIMATEILEIINYPDKINSINVISEETQVYKNLLSKLLRSKNIDFSLYKSTTINRRIQRRMAALKITNINAYSTYISENSDEVESLFNDILIGVTSFFRDQEAFHSLEIQLKKLLKNKDNKNIRIWTPGCSTGEEAYSIAIVLNEILDKNIEDYKIQIFATDIDETSIAFARTGRYPESALIDVNKKYIKKYFTVKNDEYEIIKPIRDMCIFSRHDITNDPAFMRLDLIVCRNLLIYFTNELQQRIFPMFHYSLNQSGLLFLGKSESIGNFNNQFKMIDKKWKLYEANYLGHKVPPIKPKNYKSSYKKYELDNNKGNQNIPTISEMMVEHIQRHIMPMCIVVNDAFDMIFIKGKNPYLIHPEGEATQNVFKHINGELTIELRSSLHLCKKDQGIVKTQYIKMDINDETKYVRMIIVPLDNSLTNDLFLICFQEEDSSNLTNYDISDSLDNNDKEIEKLSIELSRTREHLQTVIEELETSNEEMQSLNEELQSSNEELQSSNEELETTNEELQSTNEELQTAYTEMRAMYEERDNDAQRMSEIKTDVENTNKRLETVLNTVKVGIFDYDFISKKHLFIDENWANIFGFTIEDIIFQSNNDLMKWYESRIHKDDIDLRTKEYERLLLGKIDSYVLNIRLLHKDHTYRWVKCLSSAIRNEETNILERVLITLIDITEEKNKLIEIECIKNRLTDATELTKLGSWEWDLAKDEIWWSTEMYKIYENFVGEKIDLEKVEDLIIAEDKEKYKLAFKKAIKNSEAINLTYRIQTNNKTKYIWSRGTVVVENDIPKKLTGIVQDITEQKEKEEQIISDKNYINKLTHTSLSGMYIYNFQKNRNTYINEQYTSFTGYTLDELNSYTKGNFLSLFHKESKNAFLEHIEKVLNSKENEVNELKCRFRHKTGKYIWCLSRDTVLKRDKDGKAIEMVGSFIDITAYQDDCD